MPEGAAGALQRAQEEAQWVPEAPPKEHSGALVAPKCARMASLRNVRFDPKLRSASQAAPREDQGRPTLYRYACSFRRYFIRPHSS